MSDLQTELRKPWTIAENMRPLLTEAAEMLAAKDAEIARLRSLVRRVVDDPVWRTNDNALWRDLTAALGPAKPPGE